MRHVEIKLGLEVVRKREKKKNNLREQKITWTLEIFKYGLK